MPDPVVTILDYGVGNLRSVARAFEVCGAMPRLAETPGQAMQADRLVIPGVGAFRSCVDALRAAGFADVVEQVVSHRERPVLGICVGMQMLLDVSEEFGQQVGLGFVPGKVSRIPSGAGSDDRRKVPHIGWSSLQPPTGASDVSWSGTVLNDTRRGTDVYFVHSFAAVPTLASDVLAVTDYGGHQICAALQRDNLFGVQFHPEKSGLGGLAIVRSFLNL
ncbi:MAG: imidazole glycerol phosphate synthase subunit HisH [Minwuia sp.]|nr:imidazole glycerol phosphate synthase subunit HisH [Minwuia sp.]